MDEKIPFRDRVYLWQTKPLETPRLLLGVAVDQIDLLAKRFRLQAIAGYGADLLDQFPESFELEARSTFWGRPDDYERGRLFLRFADCKVIDKTIDDSFPTPSTDPIHLTVLVECQSIERHLGALEV